MMNTRQIIISDCETKFPLQCSVFIALLIAGRCMCGEVDHVLAVCRVLLVGVCVGKWTVSWLCRVLLVGVCVGKWTMSWLWS